MAIGPGADKYLDDLLSRMPEIGYLREPMCRAVESTCASYRSGGKVLVCGNGGSASDSEHIVGELMKGFVLRRELSADDAARLEQHGAGELVPKLQQGVAAIALTGHPSLSTAVMNDNDPLMAFAQQLYVLGRAGDVLIALSTSGRARNVLNAMKVGRAFGITNVVLTGSNPCDAWELADIRLNVPATETYRVQEYHLAIYHCLCLMVEADLFAS